jgi:hypothetical protein
LSIAITPFYLRAYPDRKTGLHLCGTRTLR